MTVIGHHFSSEWSQSEILFTGVVKYSFQYLNLQLFSSLWHSPSILRPSPDLLSGWLMCTRAKASSFREWWLTGRACSWPHSSACTTASSRASSDWHCSPSDLVWWAPERLASWEKTGKLWKCVFKFLVSQAGVPGNEWTNMLLEATTEVLKMASSPVALLFQALLQFVTKMAARSVLMQFS